MSNVYTLPDTRELAEVAKIARLGAIEILLALPDEISDGLEAELYYYRDVLNGKETRE